MNFTYHTMKFQNCVEISAAVKDSMVKAQRSTELFFRAGKSIRTLYVLNKFDIMNNSSDESNLTRILLLLACEPKRLSQSTLKLQQFNSTNYRSILKGNFRFFILKNIFALPYTVTTLFQK